MGEREPAPRCPYCGYLWVGRGIGSGHTKPAVCATCVGLVRFNAWETGIGISVPSARERAAWVERKDVQDVVQELLDAEEKRWPPAPGDPARPATTWEVTVSAPGTGVVLSQQRAEWVVPPAGVDPQFYATGRLTAALSGSDVAVDPAALRALTAGTLVTCEVRRGTAVLARASAQVGM